MQRVLHLLGGEEKAKKTLKKGIENKRWIRNNYDKLIKQYAQRFVAVLDKQVVACNADIRELLNIINEKYPDNNEIAIDFISPARNMQYFL